MPGTDYTATYLSDYLNKTENQSEFVLKFISDLNEIMNRPSIDNGDELIHFLVPVSTKDPVLGNFFNSQVSLSEHNDMYKISEIDFIKLKYAGIYSLKDADTLAEKENESTNDKEKEEIGKLKAQSYFIAYSCLAAVKKHLEGKGNIRKNIQEDIDDGEWYDVTENLANSYLAVGLDEHKKGTYESSLRLAYDTYGEIYEAYKGKESNIGFDVTKNYAILHQKLGYNIKATNLFRGIINNDYRDDEDRDDYDLKPDHDVIIGLATAFTELKNEQQNDEELEALHKQAVNCFKAASIIYKDYPEGRKLCGQAFKMLGEEELAFRSFAVSLKLFKSAFESIKKSGRDRNDCFENLRDTLSSAKELDNSFQFIKEGIGYIEKEYPSEFSADKTCQKIQKENKEKLDKLYEKHNIRKRTNKGFATTEDKTSKALRIEDDISSSENKKFTELKGIGDSTYIRLASVNAR